MLSECGTELSDIAEDIAKRCIFLSFDLSPTTAGKPDVDLLMEQRRIFQTQVLPVYAMSIVLLCSLVDSW